jgi:hypothetical protein
MSGLDLEVTFCALQTEVANRECDYECEYLNELEVEVEFGIV